MAAAHSSLLSVVGPQERVLHPKPSGRPDPTAHLSAPTSRPSAVSSTPSARASWTRAGRATRHTSARSIAAHRYIELGSRAILLFSLFPPAWLLGTAGLTVSKILDNMEIGHNVLHGQWDWMRDPQIHSTTWEWDFVSPAAQWKDTHNETAPHLHQRPRKDNDLGYGICRVDADQPWTLANARPALLEPAQRRLLRVGHRVLRPAAPLDHQRRDAQGRSQAALGSPPRQDRQEARQGIRPVAAAVGPVSAHDDGRQRDLEHPAQPLGQWRHPLWPLPLRRRHLRRRLDRQRDPRSVVCPSDARLGNISGPWIVHFLSGNLSHQIEHHLFPDLPSNRYYEIAPQVRDICRRYGLHYVSGSYPKQVASAWAKIIVLALPNKEEGRSRASIVAEAAGEAVSAKVAKFRARRAAKRAR
jgi:fatty acid desaturase